MNTVVPTNFTDVESHHDTSLRQWRRRGRSDDRLELPIALPAEMSDDTDGVLVIDLSYNDEWFMDNPELQVGVMIVAKSSGRRVASVSGDVRARRLTGEYQKTVNWSAHGSVHPDEAVHYAALMMLAVDTVNTFAELMF